MAAYVRFVHSFMCGLTSSSSVLSPFFDVVFSFGFMLLTFFLCWFMWPFIIATDFSRYCLTWCAVRLGHVVKFPASMDLTKVDFTGENADAFKYCVASYTLDISHTLLLISSCFFLCYCVIILIRVLFNVTVHNPFSLSR
jgi:hypothetical protein